MSQTNVGLIGCGAISPIYLKNLTSYPDINVAAVADLDTDRAKTRAEEHNISKICSPQALLADPEIDIVLNLTIPAAHHDVALAAIQSGKHVYNEKPLSITRQDGKEITDLAHSKNLRLGCAPDTVLGAGTQQCREIIDSGELGEIVGIQGFMMSAGVETWHPNPPFYYQTGGGPLFDMGPYYLSAFVQLLGPVKTVTGLTRISFPTRHITSQPLAGTDINVETPTHIHSLLQFESGPIGQLATSFDTMSDTNLPNIEVYGSKASLRVPDPNTFGGPIMIKPIDQEDWQEIPLDRPYTEDSRGLGILDMALAIQENRPHRASGDLAFHVLDIMHATHESADQGNHIKLSAPSVRPQPMPKSSLGSP